MRTTATTSPPPPAPIKEKLGIKDDFSLIPNFSLIGA
jgi:hypothetical protein